MDTNLTALKAGLLGVLLSVSMAYAQTEIVVPPSNRSTATLEKNLLFYATTRYTVSQSGPISLTLANFFDGNYQPNYSGPMDGINPYVVTIENLPNIHVQAGAWIGWTTRYYNPVKFKIEVYNLYDYGGLPGYPLPNTWVTVADEDNYGGGSYMASVGSVSVGKIRYTFYKGSGPDNNIGISELFFIHPEATQAFDGLMVKYDANGNVGIGTPGANIGFHNVDGDPGSSGLTWYSPAPLDYGIYRTSGPWNGGGYQQLRLQFDTGIQLGAGVGNNAGYDKSYVEIVNGKGLMVSSGNVGIGTTDTKGYKLAVAGNAIAENMTVKLQSAWGDYVFKKDYSLMPLSEVKTYIDKNQHLPEIPSAADVEKDGLNLSEMNRLLVKKVEELTLYLIELKKELDDLKSQKNQ